MKTPIPKLQEGRTLRRTGHGLRFIVKLLAAQRDLKSFVEGRAHATALDRELQSNGVNPAKYEPITATAMWDVVEVLKDVTEDKTAYESRKNWLNEKTNREKISAEAGVSVGPFSAKVG